MRISFDTDHPYNPNVVLLPDNDDDHKILQKILDADNGDRYFPRHCRDTSYFAVSVHRDFVLSSLMATLS